MSVAVRAGFTLVELLAVIAILGILAGILIPVASSARESARVAQCQGNLRQIHVACMLYVNDNKGLLPGPLTSAQPARYSATTQNSLAAHLAPYQGLAVDGTQRVNPHLLCPAHLDTAGVTTTKRSYSIPPSSDMGYPFGYSQSSPTSIQPKRHQDYITRYNPAIFWALRDDDQVLHPGNTDYALEQSHKKGRNHLFFDGSIRFLNEADQTALYHKISRGGS